MKGEEEEFEARSLMGWFCNYFPYLGAPLLPCILQGNSRSKSARLAGLLTALSGCEGCEALREEDPDGLWLKDTLISAATLLGASNRKLGPKNSILSWLTLRVALVA